MISHVSYKIVEAESSPLPKGFLASIPNRFAAEGKVIYKGRNEIKVFEVGDRTVCVKKYRIPPFLNRILYSWGWRKPKAKRTYENAQKILSRGFNTPRQYGYVLEYRNGWIRESFSVGEFVENSRTVGQDKQNAQLIRAFADYTASLHAHGLMHRDYILNNILYRQNEKGYAFTLIDINRFVFRSTPIRGFLQSMNLMQPFQDQQELNAFVQAYEAADPSSGALGARVARFRRWRNRYSAFKRFLKKLPGTYWFYKSRR